MKRTMLMVLSLALLLPTALMVAVLYPSSPAEAARDNRPDLRMEHLNNFKIERKNGKRLLRFNSKIVNVGDGRFDIRGQRPNRGVKNMSVRQRIYNNAGGFRARSTPAVMYFSGAEDGHYHWHVRNLQTFRLINLRTGRPVGNIAKRGFCFFDNSRHGSWRPPNYTVARGACGRSANLRVHMGLSVGWGDLYHRALPGQYVNITGLPPGRYRLRAVADQPNWFVEKNNRNNVTWVNLRITRGGVTVLRQGPGA